MTDSVAHDAATAVRRSVTATATDKSVVASVLKACSIFNCFSHDKPSAALGEIAALTRLNKTTTHRLLRTLELAGWIEQTPDGLYRPSFQVFRIGSVAAESINIRAAAQPVLEDLAQQFGDTAYLMVLDGSRAVTIEKVSGAYPVRISNADVGRSLPLHVGGAPIVLLAFREAELWSAVADSGLPRLARNSITNAGKLRSRLAEVREQGYALSDSDVVDGISAIGVPIRDSGGIVVAALSLGGVSDRFAPDRVGKMVPALKSAAETISRRIGWHRD